MSPFLRAVLVGVASLADLTGQMTTGELARARARGQALDLAVVGATQMIWFAVAMAAVAVTGLAALGALPEPFVFAAVLGPLSFIASTVALVVAGRRD